MAVGGPFGGYMMATRKSLSENGVPQPLLSF